MHVTPHAPQFAGSMRVSVHEPAQDVSRAGQAHCPNAHVLPAMHVTPQAPQLRASIARSAHPPAQLTSFDGHPPAHAPLEQT